MFFIIIIMPVRPRGNSLIYTDCNKKVELKREFADMKTNFMITALNHII